MKARSLVIVESPAKAKTIAKVLGSGFIVESSIGHIRDLPRSAKDVPAAHKGTTLGRLGVDVEHDFKPLYILDPDKKDRVKRLKQLLKDADLLYLATDEDREGESIAWHLVEVLKPSVPVKRMAFHEITPQAIREAIQHPRDIDQRLVNAQEARRILDRLYGYEVSPVLWKKVMPKLSAGRVQSVATRIVVEREAARMRFVRARYWDIDGIFTTPRGGELGATLTAVDGRAVATGKDFDEQGKLRRAGAVILEEKTVQQLARELQGTQLEVGQVERKASRRAPAPPFMTSTLQQEAGHKLRFAAARTMRAAQVLYEQGYITYMRTDSTTLSDVAVAAARHLILEEYGQEYLPAAPRTYKNKVKNAQEAHEAIRPAGETFRSPKEVAGEVGHDEGRLYELIWMRTVASQMQDARLQSVRIVLRGRCASGSVEFSAVGSTIEFPGFLRAYVEGSDDPEADLGNRERPLPPVTEGEWLGAKELTPREHETQPPARFTEASLVKRLEELGVGRPSTYASILSTIQQRGYVWKKGTALVPSFKAFAVNQLLEQHFGTLVDYSFTAKMEDELDSIASGQEELVPWLRRFYFGARPEGGKQGDWQGASDLDLGLHRLVSDQLEKIDARAINSLSLGNDGDGRAIVVRVGRFGTYLQCEQATAPVPDDLPPDELTIARAVELLGAPSGERVLGQDPETGLSVKARSGRFGPYVQLGEPGGKKDKPKTCSLFGGMSLDTITLDEAVRLLSLPRQVGLHPETDQPITAQLGRYGPYLLMGSDSRTIEGEESLFAVTLAQAVDLFKQPKRRGQRQIAGPLREFGAGASGKVVVLRQGRFGPYVTDGETNASLRRGDNVEQLTLERAEELLGERRAQGPAPKKPRTTRRAASAPSKPRRQAGAASVQSSKAPRAKSRGPTRAKARARSRAPA